MKALPLVALSAPVLMLTLGTVSILLPTRGAPPSDARVDGRRWPAEIETLLSSMPVARGASGASAPLIETDQRCSRVEDGLAHCVMLECQSAGGQTACFEMVVTARRLHELPVSMRDEDAAPIELAPMDARATSSL